MYCQRIFCRQIVKAYHIWVLFKILILEAFGILAYEDFNNFYLGGYGIPYALNKIG